ncbi:MAG: MYXO-CTERM sorting domain-containing protein [Planctomycetota bacterium]
MKYIGLIFTLVLLAQTGSAQSTLNVQNTVSTDVTETYISLSSSSTWGSNLGSVPGNSTVGFGVTGGDFYDLAVVFANTDTMTVTNIWVGFSSTVTEQVEDFAGTSGGGGGGGDDGEGCVASSTSGNGLALIGVLGAVAVWVRRRKRIVLR